MFTPRAWTDLATTSYQMTAMALEAQAVIWMRLWGMAGAWNVSPGENRRMVAEKVKASLQAQQSAALALAAGKSPVQAVAAAVKPIRRKTSSNLSRLSKRGPKLK